PAPPPPLTTEMVGGTDPNVQPAAAPQAPATPPQGDTSLPAAPAPAAPATAVPAQADTGHAAHADSGHAGH
ncbi:MAG TPA: hypothetical protein VHG93_02815, partial [Longimicrobium sp.]|nr:hypothetical protein [Longimicrobium sp.]